MRTAIIEARAFLQHSKDNDPTFPRNDFNDLQDTEDLMTRIEFLVTHTYIANSKDSVYKQTIGIPMGTNCAPEIANLVLYVYESEYIDELVANGNLIQAKKHRYSRRFIDDIITFGTDPIPMDKYGDLEYSEQTNEDGSVNFLGATIGLDNGMMKITRFDKTTAWKFPVLKYPAASSNIPIHQIKGVFIGETKRFQMMVNTLSAFKQAVGDLTRDVFKRGHDMRIIQKAWTTYLTRHGVYAFSRHQRRSLKEWFPRMLRWACRPNPRIKPTRDPPFRLLIGPVQQQPQQQPHFVPPPMQPVDLGEELEEEFRASQQNSPHESEAEEEPELQDQPVVNLQQQFQQIQIQYGLEHLLGLINLQPNTLPPIVNGVQTLWTEDYVSVEGMINTVKQQGNVVCNKLLPGILQKIASRNQRLIESGIINAEQVQDGLPPPMMHNRNDSFKNYCQYCWQRYCKKCKHSVDLCVRNQALRDILVNSFH